MLQKKKQGQKVSVKVEKIDKIPQTQKIASDITSPLYLNSSLYDTKDQIMKAVVDIQSENTFRKDQPNILKNKNNKEIEQKLNKQDFGVQFPSKQEDNQSYNQVQNMNNEEMKNSKIGQERQRSKKYENDNKLIIKTNEHVIKENKNFYERSDKNNCFQQQDDPQLNNIQNRMQQMSVNQIEIKEHIQENKQKYDQQNILNRKNENKKENQNYNEDKFQFQKKESQKFYQQNNQRLNINKQNHQFKQDSNSNLDQILSEYDFNDFEVNQQYEQNVPINEAYLQNNEAKQDQFETNFYQNVEFNNKEMLKFSYKQIGMVYVVKADLTTENSDVIVNAANAQLLLGGGVAGAIKSKGGSSIQKECDKIQKIMGRDVRLGGVAMTNAGNMCSKKVLHAVGPIWKDYEKNNNMKSLYNAVRNCLFLANKNKFRSISFPAISSGIFGFPKDLCAKIFFQAISEFFNNKYVPSEIIKSKNKYQHDYFNQKEEKENSFQQPAEITLKHIRLVNFDLPTAEVFYLEQLKQMENLPDMWELVQ